MFTLSLCFFFHAVKQSPCWHVPIEPLFQIPPLSDNCKQKEKKESVFQFPFRGWESILHIHSHREKSVKYSIIGGEENDSKIFLNLSQSPITPSDNTCFTVNEKNQVSENHPFMHFRDVPWLFSQLVASSLQDSLGWQQGNCLQICNTQKQCNSSSVRGNDYVLCWGSFSLRWSHIWFKSDMPEARLVGGGDASGLFSVNSLVNFQKCMNLKRTSRVGLGWFLVTNTDLRVICFMSTYNIGTLGIAKMSPGKQRIVLKTVR